MDTQTQIERLIELAIVQRTELKQLVEQLPQLREHLNAEIEKVFEEVEPQLRAELEDWTAKQTTDQTAKLGAALEAKINDLAKALEVSTQARYSAILAEREKNFALAAEAEAKIAEHAASLPDAVKGIVDAELARFPRAGEIDQLRKEFAEPKSLNPRGKWQSGVAYNKLDLVTINGDSYTSATDNNRTRPTRSSADWTLVAARGTGGGGGPTSLSELTTVPSNGDLLIGSGTSWVTSNLTAGAGISITVGAGEITISATDGDITLDDGTAASPSLHFTNDPDTGLYRPAANTLGISVSGTQIAYFDENGLTIPNSGVVAGGSFHGANGNANNPSHSFTSDQDTGFYRHATNQIGVSTNGTASLIFTDKAGELLGHTGVSVTFGAGSSGATIALGQGSNGGVTITSKGSGTAVVNGTTIPSSKTLVVTTDKLSALAATTSAELAGVISDETGSGALVFATSPTLTTPILGTPQSGTLSSCTGLPISTGVSGLGTNVATALGTAVGSAGAFVVNGGALGTPSSGTLTNATGLPISSGISGLGTNVATALAVAVGSAGGVVVNGGALGTPSSGTLTNATGLPISTGVSGLGTNVATFLATPSSANLASAVTDETGTGALVFANTPTLVTPNIGAATGTSFNLTGSGTLGTTLTVNGTTDSTSKDTGAIVTEGGLGVEKSATFGGNLTVSGTGNSSVAGTFLVATTTNSSNGRIQLATHTTSAGGIGFGTDTSLYRTVLGQLALNAASGGYASLGLYSAGSSQGQLATAGNQIYLDSGQALYLRTNGSTTALTLDSSQNATFAGSVKAPKVYSGNGSVSVAAGATETIFAPSDGVTQVLAYIDAYDPTAWSATATVTKAANNATLRIVASNTGIELSVSGSNVRVKNTGAGSVTVKYVYQRISEL